MSGGKARKKIILPPLSAFITLNYVLQLEEMQYKISPSYLFKQQITERLSKLAILHQQEVAQSFKMSFHSQIHKEVVHHRFVHQRHTGDTKGQLEEIRDSKVAYLHL